MASAKKPIAIPHSLPQRRTLERWVRSFTDHGEDVDWAKCAQMSNLTVEAARALAKHYGWVKGGRAAAPSDAEELSA